MDHRAALRHHGDVDAEPGLLDFAVNVQGDGAPPWLRDRLARPWTTWPATRPPRTTPGPGPPSRPATAAARRGALPGRQREGFALLPGPATAAGRRRAPRVHRARRPRCARRASTSSRCSPTSPTATACTRTRCPADADLVVIGQPDRTRPGSCTPPTDVARSPRRAASAGRRGLRRRGPGEPETLAGADLPGLLVFRSLTKTWALAGLRAGYALGDPALLARLAAPRPPWPVSTPAVEAVLACAEPLAVAEAAAAAERLTLARAAQADALSAVPGVTVLPGRAPYLLLRLPDGRGPAVRAALRAAGIAVRRGDTFPGLGPDHVRVAVRPAPQVARLAAALSAALAGVAA
jgi:histidinol-phosphate aminotransferase